MKKYHLQKRKIGGRVVGDDTKEENVCLDNYILIIE